MADEIIMELWEIKDTIAREYNFDLDALIEHLKTKQSSKSYRVVDLHDLRKKPATGTVLYQKGTSSPT